MYSFNNLNIELNSLRLINKTVNAIINPTLDLFIKHLSDLSEERAISLTKELLELDLRPLHFNFKVDSTYAPTFLSHTSTLPLSLLRTSLKNRSLHNNLIPLMLVRNKKVTLLPSWETVLEKNDHYLFAGDANAKEHLEYIAQNINEFHYALYGTEKGFLNGFWQKFSKNA